jgi:hypothetical protein
VVFVFRKVKLFQPLVYCLGWGNCSIGPEQEIIDVDCRVQAADDHPHLCVCRRCGWDEAAYRLIPTTGRSSIGLDGLNGAEGRVAGVAPFHLQFERERVKGISLSLRNNTNGKLTYPSGY